MRIGELAAASGVPAKTIRYEDIGVLDAPRAHHPATATTPQMPPTAWHSSGPRGPSASHSARSAKYRPFAFERCELLVGLGEVRVLAVTEGPGLVVTVETTDDQDWCLSCGLRATVKDRPSVVLGDLACFGRPATLVWRKRRWSCPAGCGGWTERNDAIAAPRCALTRRAGLWATEQVGRLARPVSQVAAELGVAWHTVMDAVVLYGTKLVTDPARVEGVEAIGVDETKWLAAKAKAPTRWASAVVDVKSPRVLDMLEGRNAGDLGTWLAARTPAWRDAIKVATCDLHEPFRAAFDEHIPDASQVADPFHVVAVGTRVIDRARRRVQNETLGHRAARPTRSTGHASCSPSRTSASTSEVGPSSGACSPPATPTARSPPRTTPGMPA